MANILSKATNVTSASGSLPANLAQRRFDLDWLRVIAILMVFVFHTTRFFDPLDWHVKNATTYEFLAFFAAFFTLWGMPLIFVVSGASLWFASKYSMPKFVDDKVRRLLVPLVVGIFTAGVVQVYLERITHRQFSGSLFDFIPQYFNGWYPYNGNFAWMGMHLWYLEFLFLYSLLLMPVFYWLKNGSGQETLRRLGEFLARPLMIFSVGIAVGLLLVVLDPNTIWGERGLGAWSFVPYILFLLAGFVVMSHDGVQKRIVAYRWLSCALGGILTIGLMYYYARSGLPTFGSSTFSIFFLLFGFTAWCWIQLVLGLGFKYLNTPRPILAYAGEAVLAFYILHQTVLLVVGYFIVRWQIPDLLKWASIAVVSFAVVMLVYQFIVRPFNVMRFLFGMKPLTKTAQSLTPKQHKVPRPI